MFLQNDDYAYEDVDSPIYDDIEEATPLPSSAWVEVDHDVSFCCY